MFELTYSKYPYDCGRLLYFWPAAELGPAPLIERVFGEMLKLEGGGGAGDSD